MSDEIKKFAEFVQHMEDNWAKEKEMEYLRKLESGFYMAICRAYNAGKQNQINQQIAIGSPDEGKMFLSSHDYFITEFPGFKKNVP